MLMCQMQTIQHTKWKAIFSFKRWKIHQKLEREHIVIFIHMMNTDG